MLHRWRVLERFAADVLVTAVLAIILGIFPMTWWLKAFLLLLLAFILVELMWRSAVAPRLKPVAAVLILIAVCAIGRGIVLAQYDTDALLRDYKTTRDLAAKFQGREASLKGIVAQYDRLQQAQSLFDAFHRAPDQVQHDEIEKARVEDLRSVLGNLEAIATPEGVGLRIKLGPNFYRVINPVPMRIVPKRTFLHLPAGAHPVVVDESNLGFTVLFLPLSISVNQFELTQDAEF